MLLGILGGPINYLSFLDRYRYDYDNDDINPVNLDFPPNSNSNFEKDKINDKKEGNYIQNDQKRGNEVGNSTITTRSEQLVRQIALVDPNNVVIAHI